jgi:hypothetical protein
MTRTRGLHATSSSIRTENYMSSLPERRIAHGCFLFRWCAHVPHPKFQDSGLRRLMAWFPGAYDLRALSWAHVRVWGAAGRGCRTPGWPGCAHFVRSCNVNRALHGISTSAVACVCRHIVFSAWQCGLSKQASVEGESTLGSCSTWQNCHVGFVRGSGEISERLGVYVSLPEGCLLCTQCFGNAHPTNLDH